MAFYRYKAMTAAGTLVRGVLDAPTEADVIQRLRERGQFPIWAREKGVGSFWTDRRFFGGARKPSLRNLYIVTQEMGTLMRAGLELDRTLGVLMALGEMGGLRQSFATARERVRGGMSFADALGADPNFPKFYVGMVRAGEMSGTLEDTMRQLADYLLRTLSVREAVTSALVYPIILLVTAAMAIIFIVSFVLPEFEPLFQQSGKAIPQATLIVMGIGDAIRYYWWVAILAGIAAAFALRSALANPASQKKIHRFMLRLPLLGPLLTAIEIERFCRTLGTSLSNGVSLPAGLNLAKDVLWNSALAETVKDTAASLREGESIVQRLKRSNLFPAVTLDLIRVGEEVGKLDEMLLRQADLEEQRIRHSIDRLLAWLVPGLTIVLGLIVGGLIASMLTAILSINDLALE